MNKQIKEKFDEVAEKYDSQRKYLVPCLNDFYTIVTDLIDIDHDQPTILDMGAGTGLLTSYIYQKYKKGSYTLIDLSEEMLKVAEDRFSEVGNFEYIAHDYISFNYSKKYDAVVSALSIHHLSDSDKQAVYDKAFSILDSDGIFINADQVLGSSEDSEVTNRKNWIRRIEESPLDEKEKEAAYIRMSLDKMATLNDNINMLKKSGFKTVDVYYKYFNFAVICAKA